MNDIDDRQEERPKVAANLAADGVPKEGVPGPAQRRAAKAQKKDAIVARQQAALRLRLAGATFDGIAKQLGFAFKSGAQKACRIALQAPGRTCRNEARQVCRLRYERLLLTWWPKALAGDDKATGHVCNLLADLRSLDALDLPRRHRMEHAGEGGGPIQLQSTSAPSLSRLTDEQLQQYRELIDFLLDGPAPGPGPDSPGPAAVACSRSARPHPTTT
jgi:hypothetical protein